jgi:hypothetical protein
MDSAHHARLHHSHSVLRHIAKLSFRPSYYHTIAP